MPWAELFSPFRAAISTLRVWSRGPSTMPVTVSALMQEVRIDPRAPSGHCARGNKDTEDNEDRDGTSARHDGRMLAGFYRIDQCLHRVEVTDKRLAP